MEPKKELDVSLIPYEQCAAGTTFDLDQIIYDLDSQIELLSSQADTLDYLVAVASGILCGMLDVLWVGEFKLERGREIASDKVESFVKKAAKLTGCESDDLGASVKHMEKLFPIPSDGNTPDFGGGLQHHLRDFAHHPTIVGLMFSLLTQFTYKSYGTNTAGAFIVVDVPEKSRPFIGEDIPTKILYGTLTWFFHLVGDMAGSSSTAGKTGGTGIPGPLLALAKELSALPFCRDLQVGEHGISLFLSKLFNGTLLAQHDENGQIIKDTVMKIDLRGELGIAVELGRQAIPVVANECIVRGFYFVRRLAMELKENHIRSLSEIRNINWDNVKPAGNPTIARMLTVATGVFTTVDLGDAIISQKYWVSINYVGIGRFAVAIVKADAFKHLKKPHDYYRDLLKKNKSRLEQALVHTLTEEQLHNRLYKLLCDFYSVDDSQQRQEAYQSFLHEKADKVIEELKKINPISGAVYSFKQGVAIGDRIIADSAFELKRTKERLSSKQLSRFLEDYNGIKLYRGKYRIGFLGNKESDWIKLQQFRTKGQQWYRFDLGNTIGYVSINDSAQNHIQEISSRLDISQNQTSEAFKLLINLVFNYLFYELNKKANEIIRIFLTEEGLVEERITKKVKKSNEAIKAVLVRNKKMQKALKDVATQLSLHEQIGPDRVALSRSSFDFVTSTLSSIASDIRQDYAAQETTAHVLATADAQLSAVEVEAYNNYKLMANGLITETITHELHSLSETGIKADAGIHFAFLRDYFVQNAQAKVYNQHVHPIRNSYDGISGKLEEISDMYKFLETTFIKKGTYDEFVYQNIQDLVDSIKANLIRTTKKEKIEIICETNDLEWCVPKGVMLHVFYNLFNNSLYWIDIRRKWAQSDPFYESNAKDCIVVEEFGLNGLIVSDSGTGVSREMEDLLFSPLESGRPAGEGRGMGLYIVKKLLKSFGADIELLEERNAYGNRYKFLIVLNSETK